MKARTITADQAEPGGAASSQVLVEATRRLVDSGLDATSVASLLVNTGAAFAIRRKMDFTEWIEMCAALWEHTGEQLEAIDTANRASRFGLMGNGGAA